MRILLTTHEVGGRTRFLLEDEEGQPLPNQRSVTLDDRGKGQVVSVAFDIDDVHVINATNPNKFKEEGAGPCTCGTSQVCETHEGRLLDCQ